MNIRTISFLPVLLLSAWLLPGCSETSTPAGPSPGGRAPSQSMVVQLHWSREVRHDTTKVVSYLFIDCMNANSQRGVEAGVVRFQGMEIAMENNSLYKGYWNALPVGEGGRYKGPFAIEASGSANFAQFADTISVDVAEPAITSPLAGDTISISKGFVLEWEKRSGGGKVEIVFASHQGKRRKRSGKVADNGRLVVEPDMVEGLEPGKWSIGITRTYSYSRDLPGSRQSRVSIFPSHTVYITTKE